MDRERKTSGIFVVNLDPQMPDGDKQGYIDFVNRVTKLPMEWRYKAMAQRPLSCVEAVVAWQLLQTLFPEYRLGDQVFSFSQNVKDHYGFTESGQDMLRVQLRRLSNSDNFCVVDVAGYLFGFPYEEMLVAAGSLDYVSDQVTRHYSQRYPGLAVIATKGT